MQTGTKISGAAHLLLLGAAVFGGAFRSEPLPFEVREVSLISAEEFAAMTAPRTVPDVAAQPVAPRRPEPETESPEVAALPDDAPARVVPEQAAPARPDEQPEALPDTPAPEAEVGDSAPVLEPPAPDEPVPEVVVEPAPPAPRPQTRPVDRVAPVPVAPPPPDARPDDVERAQVNPDEGAENPQEPQEATAPEEANDRIITEADDTATLAPTRSPRPRARPERRIAAAPKPEPAPDPAKSAVNDALAEALGGGSPAAAPVPSGPPLTGGEKDALRVAVSKCWNVGSLSSAALRTTVVVGVSMTPEGKPVSSSIRMLSSSGGPDAAAKQAFEAARRAILRCGARGYDLPAEKYGQWQEIEMTFNPERMRIK